jgi:hypothetical protein
MIIELDKDSSSLPEAYADYSDVFKPIKTAKLQTQTHTTHAINLEDKAKSLYGSIYHFSELKLRTLRDYLAKNKLKKWIRRSKSSAKALILFMPKSNEGLRLYIDYHALNKLTVKNKHALPLIDETINKLSNTKIYIKLNLKNAYYRIRIKANNK